MNKAYLNSQFDESETINIREELEKYLIHWKWFLAGIILSVAMAFLYLRYSTPQYSAKTVVLIKENKKGGVSAELKAFEDLGILGGSTNNIDNEIEIIKSRKIIGDVIKKLNYNISYFSEGRVIGMEIYDKHSPVIVKFKKKDSLFYEIDTTFTINIISKDRIELKSKLGELMNTVHFDEVINSEIGEFQISRNNKLDEFLSPEKIIVGISPINGLIDSYQASVNISPVNKNSSVINLSLNGSVLKKAENFLDALVFAYNEDAVIDKSQVSKKTKFFIDERLMKIGKDLDLVNNNLKNFKAKNKLTNIEAESELVLKTISENTKKIIETSIQLKLVQSLNADLKKSQIKGDELLATNLGLEDVSIAQLISEYNKLVLTKRRLLRTASNLNPQIIDLVSQIDGLKSSLQQSLNNSESGLKLTLEQFKKEEIKIASKIAGIPTQELALKDIKLQQEITAGLYTYLLKKKEETAISLAVTVANAKIIDKAYGSSIPVSPKRKIIYLAALLLGLLIPFVSIYLKNLLDTKIHSKKDLEAFLSIPFLGDVPKNETQEKIVIGSDMRSSTAEAFRLIRTNLDFMLTHKKGEAKTIFVTSTTSGEGKSFISINVASSLALSGKKVLLMGMDLRAPKITTYLEMPDKKGVTNYIADETISFENLLFNVEDINNLDIMSSGAVPPNPAELLMTPKVEKLFELVKEKYDYIIVDTAPVNLVTDTLLLAKYADLFLYVVRANYLDKRLLTVPQALYNEKRLPNMALVLNDTDSKLGYGYGYGYGVTVKKPWYKKIFRE